MQSEKELHFTAQRFVEIAETHLSQAENELGTNATVNLPMQQAAFDRVIEVFELIQKLGEEKNISIELSNAREAFYKYGHTRCFTFERIK